MISNRFQTFVSFQIFISHQLIDDDTNQDRSHEIDTNSVQRQWIVRCFSMLYNRINQFLDRFNVTLNADGGSHNWTELDAFNEFNENITLSHIINFFTRNDSLDVSNDMLNMTEKFRQLDESIGASLRLGFNSTVDLDAFSHNVSGGAAKSDSDAEPLFVLISVTICYLFIFVAGVLGNVITCTVISRNKSMHTATNYYLFNLAISDLILLLSGKLRQCKNIHLIPSIHSSKWINVGGRASPRLRTQSTHSLLQIRQALQSEIIINEFCFCVVCVLNISAFVVIHSFYLLPISRICLVAWRKFPFSRTRMTTWMKSNNKSESRRMK